MTYALLMVVTLSGIPHITPIVQTNDAKSCRQAKEVMAQVFTTKRDVALVCVPGVLVMPMDGPNAD